MLTLAIEPDSITILESDYANKALAKQREYIV